LLLGSALIHLADHNISPPLGKQLVLELEGGMGFAKRRDRLPSGFGHWHSRPFDEDVPHAAAKFGA
jgi:hypothetical protein